MEIVEHVLSTYPETRSDDKKLLLAVWHFQGFELTKRQKQIFHDKCAIAETITRDRRLLRGRYPAKPEVEEARYEKAKICKKVYAHKNY